MKVTATGVRSDNTRICKFTSAIIVAFLQNAAIEYLSEFLLCDFDIFSIYRNTNC